MVVMNKNILMSATILAIYFSYPAVSSSGYFYKNAKVPVGFEFIEKTGMPVDLYFAHHGEKENQEPSQVRIKLIDDKFHIYWMSEFDVTSVKKDYFEALQRLMRQGIPKSGLFCSEAKVYFGEELNCSLKDVIVNADYDTKYLSLTLTLNEELLDFGSRERNVKYIPDSSVNDVSGMFGYRLSLSGRDTVGGNLETETIVGKGNDNFRVLTNYQVSDSKSYTDLDVAEWRNVSGEFEKKIGLIDAKENIYNVSPQSRSLLGIQYGKTDAVLTNNGTESSVPINFVMSENGRVEVYRNNRLINSRFYNQGLQTLQTKDLPNGVYEIEVRIYNSSGLVSTRKEYIYKLDERYSNGFYFQTGAGVSDNSFSNEWVFNSGYNDLISASWAYDTNLSISNNVKALGFGLDSTFLLGSFRNKLSITDEKNISLFSQLYVELYGLETNSQFSYNELDSTNTASIYTGYNVTSEWRFYGYMDYSFIKGRNDTSLIGAAYTPVSGYFKRWRFSAEYNNKYDEDYSLVSVNIPLWKDLDFTQRYYEGNSSSNLSYHKFSSDPNDSIRSLGLNTSKNWTSPEKDYLEGTSGFSTQLFTGNAGVNLNKESDSYYSNLKGAVYFPGGPSNRKNESALLVRTPEFAVGQMVVRTNKYEEIPIDNTEILIPMKSFSKNSITMDLGANSTRSLKIDRVKYENVLYPGNVDVVDISVTRSINIIGRLLDVSGNPIENQIIKSDFGLFSTNEKGVFSTEISMDNPIIEWGNCKYTIDYDYDYDSYLYSLGDIYDCVLN
ncbi:Mat/Ecp fimbriae outer membrane usher protein [Vibrio crassostreae]|nr:Mat/Ecp fimbriae outer membrane usher protein [Vibrio crassostreae]